MTGTPKITPHLWYVDDLFGAIDFYTGIFPESSVQERSEIAPGVRTAEFTLGGQRILGLQAQRDDIEFNDLFSFMVHCEDQDELDRYWNALLDGGTAQQCGWLIDRYGMRWQIVPTALDELMADPDPARRAGAVDAMMGMVKLDIATLRAAADAASTTS